MSSSRLHDPSQLTVFAPLPCESEPPKSEGSVFSKVLQRVTGSSKHSSQSSLSRRASAFDSGILISSTANPRFSVNGSSVELGGMENSSDYVGPVSALSLYPPNSVDHSEISELDGSTEGLLHSQNARTLENVIRRVKEIAAKAPLDLQPFHDSDFKQFWVPDSSSKECYECDEKFTTFRRRRHCRVCGHIFCSRCANQEIPGHSLGYSGTIRMCSFCSQVALSYARYSHGHSGSHSSQFVEQSSLPGAMEKTSIPSLGSTNESRYQMFYGHKSLSAEQDGAHSNRDAIGDLTMLSFEHLREIWLEMNHKTEGLELKIHRHRFRAFPNCVSGAEIVDWLLKRKKATGRQQATKIGQGLLNYKFVESLTSHDTIFLDEYVLYKPKTVTTELEDVSLLAEPEFVENDEPTWLRDIHEGDSEGSSKFDATEPSEPDELDLVFGKSELLRHSESNISLNSQHPITTSTESPPRSPVLTHAPVTQVPEERAFISLPELDLWRGRSASFSSVPTSTEISVAEALDQTFLQKFHKIVHQLQNWEDLDQEWHDLIVGLAAKVTENVSPNVQEKRDDMDIRQYVHIKKIPGGKPSESRVVYGVVCTKHVAHRKMRQTFTNPRILLYGTALDYEALDPKLTSIEPVMLEEAEFLKGYVERIAEFQPDILLVERNVSRLAQEYLFQENITLVAHVKQTVMNRLARQTQADKYSVIEKRLMEPRLGTCVKFDVKNVTFPDDTTKSYMTFDGCPKDLGCTVLLRGGDKDTLLKVKTILMFAIYCRYNWKLERSFLLDEHASLPPSFEVPHVPSSNRFSDILPNFESSISPFIRPLMPFLESDLGARARKISEIPLSIFASRLMQKAGQTTLTADRACDNSNGLDNTANGRSDSVESDVAAENTSLVQDEETGYCGLLPEPDNPYSSPVVECAAAINTPKDNHNVEQGHTFLQVHFTKNINHPSSQKVLAHFRAYGSRTPRTPSLEPSSSTSGKPNQKPVDPIDCFCLYQHQRLPILCSIHAAETANANATFCIFPWILVIEFYGKNDLTLGDYLETFCFRSEAKCPNQNCNRSVKEHVRKFACGDSAISVTIRDLESGNSAPLNKVLTWTWCRICREAGPVCPLSQAAWSISFAKYLDLRLHAVSYQRTSLGSCRHSLHRDHLQFFAHGHTVAAFKVDTIKVREISGPTLIIAIDDSRSLSSRQDLIESAKTIAIKGHNVFATIMEYLSACQNLEREKLDERISSLMATKRGEKQLFRDRLECIQVKLASPLLKFDAVTPEDVDRQKEFVWDIEDSLTGLKREITKTAIVWSSQLGDLEAARKREEKRSTTLKSFQSTPEFVREESVVTISLEPPSDMSTESVDFSVGSDDIDDPSSAPHQTEMSSPFPERLHHSVTCVGPFHSSPIQSVGISDIATSQRTINTTQKQKSVIAGSGTNIVPLPFPPNEHYMFPESDRIPVVVYDEELSSMIAYTLNSPDYDFQLSELTKNTNKKEPRSSRNTSAERARSPLSEAPNSSTASDNFQKSSTMAFLRDLMEGSSPFGTSEISNAYFHDEDNTEDLSPEPKSKSTTKSGADQKEQKFIEVQFSDPAAKFYCRVYFPEEFRQLRSEIFPYGEERFIRSLARSVAWKAGGGKSGSTFSKTADGRFVLKQMLRLEVQSFMEFAPHYFTYVLQCLKRKQPTVMAKVVGVYRIGFRNSQTGAVAKQDLLVMENLFYGRKVQQVYDLKGSRWNRLASTNCKADAELVLLDENFLKYSCENPLYIRPHAKQFLRKALIADTQFLANLCVVDYSLLVGIDEENNEIVVGIIDYIRTFTWDKRLEMVVKSLGGQGKQPTIVSPELYRTRFCEAMERYFLPVPDQWHLLARFMEGI